MKLYYSPGACSLAPHIALQESGLAYTTEAVDLQTGQYKGGDFSKLNPKGYVPTLQTEDKEILTENAVILQYIADRAPDANLMPKPATWERYRCMEWLNYVATEIHKSFSLLWRDDFPEDVKQLIKNDFNAKFDFLSKTLDHQNYLMGDTFTVPDAYLFVVLRWTKAFKMDMTKWPALMGFMERVHSRPATQTALKDESPRPKEDNLKS